MKKITIDTLFELSFLANLQHSPHSGQAAFVCSRMDERENLYRSYIWLSDGERVRLLTAGGAERSFCWENEKSLLFQASREKADKERQDSGLESSSFYRLATDGGEAVKAFDLPLQVGRVECLAENLYLIDAESGPRQDEFWKLPLAEREKEAKERKEMSFREVVEEIPFYSNGRGYLRNTRQRLFLYRAERAELLALTDASLDVEGWRLSEDKKRVLLIASRHGKRAELYNGLYALNLESLMLNSGDEGGEASFPLTELVPENRVSIKDAWESGACDGEKQIFILASDMRSYGLNQSAALYLLDRETQNITRLSADEIRVGSSVNSDCCYGETHVSALRDGEYYYLTTVEDHSVLRKINREGHVETLFERDGAVLSFALPASGEAENVANGCLALALFDRRPAELYELSFATGESAAEEGGRGSFRRLSDFNHSLMADYHIAEAERISMPDDADLQGFVLLPPAFRADQSYPAILNIHGGPRTVYGDVFLHEMQCQAAMGFVVLFCNPRGSDGRGDAFADIRGQYGRVDYENLLAFLDRALEQYPAIDKERIGVSGGSYGGFMVNWMIGHTDRFACAVSQRSISNWISMYGTSDIGYHFAVDQNGCDSLDQAGFMKLWEHSPLRTVNGAKTATLFIHAEEDYRCPLEQAMQMFTALLDRGVEARMLVFKAENHELSRSGRPKARRERLRAILDWQSRFLLRP